MDADVHHEDRGAAKRTAWWRSGIVWVFGGFAPVVTDDPLAERPRRAPDDAPYALLVLCPFLHLPGHCGGHKR